jgi:hypothetical protein
MSDFTLGQRVRFTDRLVRVNIYLNGPRSEELLQSALDLMSTPRSYGTTTYRGLDWKLWVPESFAREHLHQGLTMIEYSTTPPAGEGVITQRATLQQGGTHGGSYDESACWLTHGTTRAYKIAFDLHRKPVHALPEHITPLEPAP